LVALASLLLPAMARAQTTYSGGGVSFPASTTNNPSAVSSTINVSGAPGTVATVKVVLLGVKSDGESLSSGPVYNSLAYAEFLLEGPGGEQLVLLAQTGDTIDGCDQNQNDDPCDGLQGTVSPAANPDTITIVDGVHSAPNGAGSLGEQYEGWQTSYMPYTVAPTSTYNTNADGPPPLPVTENTADYPQPDGSATLNGRFGGTQANGAWTLYLIDNNFVGGGTQNDPFSITGWNLILTFSVATPTTTTLSSSASNPAFYANSASSTSITYTATVSSGAGTPTGTVTFQANGSTISGCSGVALSSGVAHCTVSLAQGDNSITAAYTPTGSFGQSDASLSQMVEVTAANPSGTTWCNNSLVSVPANDNPGLAYPSIIGISDSSYNGKTVGNVTVELEGVQGQTSGIAGQFLLVAPGGGAYNLDFMEAGFAQTGPTSAVDLTFEDSASGYMPYNTGTPGGGPYLPTDNNEGVNSDTFPASNAPTVDTAIPQVPGTINFAPPYGTDTTRYTKTNILTFGEAFNGAPANGKWSLYTVGPNAVNLNSGWCITLSLNTGNATTTTLTPSSNPATTGNSVTFTAAVTSGGNPVTSNGTVTFLDNNAAPAGTVSGNNVVTLNGSGLATFTTSSLSEGDHSITASYSGTASDNSSFSSVLYQRINTATTATQLSSNEWQYCNPGAVQIQGGTYAGPFTPNPSVITVTNLPGTLNTVGVQLTNFSVSSTYGLMELASLVEGPSGAALDFFSNTTQGNGAGTADATLGNYTFEDSAGGLVTSSLTNINPGDYKPTAYESYLDSADVFTSSTSGLYPAPTVGNFSYAAPTTLGSSSTFAGVFTNGSDANGAWKLFFSSGFPNTTFGAANGWCVNLTENLPTVSVDASHTGTFTQGQLGAPLTVGIDNNGATGPTGDPSGTNPMTVTDTLNSAFTYSGFSGTNWSCSAASQVVTCTNDSAIAQGSSYPALTINVNVGANASGNITNSATASGAGVSSTTSPNDTISIDTAPAITSATGTTFTVGSSGTFTVTTTGTPYPTISETGALPSGITFIDNGNGTATLSGTPAVGTGGSYPFTITASNGVGTNATQNFTLTVQLPQYVLTTAAYPVAGGTVTPASGNLYTQGTSVQLTATPNTGYTFIGWTSSPDAVASPTSASTTIPMNAAESVTANFTPTLVVNTTADDAGNAANCSAQATPGMNTVDTACSLRDALQLAANDGSGSITFDGTAFGSAQSIILTNGQLNIPSNTTITGPTTGSGKTLANLVTVNGNAASTVFSVNSGVTNASLSGLIITNGSSATGGGIASGGNLTITGSTISGNKVSSNSGDIVFGGGIENGGTLTITESTISGNSATTTSGGLAGGGGIVNTGTLTITDSTISGNSATAAGSGGGGGIVNSSGSFTITNSTISANTADASAGGILNNGGPVNLANTIVSGNSAPISANLGGISPNDNGGNQLNLSAAAINLATLGNYGGPTQTMPPLPGSAAICAGTVANETAAGLTTDQRGLPDTNTSYPGYSSGTPCVDAGAVQTSYAMAFTTEPPSSISTNVLFTAPNIPAVTLSESGSTATEASSTVSSSSGLTAVTLSGTTSATLSAGVGSFSGLTLSSTTNQTGETLTATLNLNGSLNLTATSNTFNVIAITLSPTTLNSGTVGVAYSQQITASNGTGPYAYAATSGSLPAGLTLTLNGANAGLLSGTPTAGGTFNFTITATDSLSNSGSQAYTLSVSAPTITVAPATLASGTYGTSYNQSVSASGGTGPYTYALSSGSSLPPGLSLSSFGAITGTPTAASASAYTFTIIATDSSTGTGPYTGRQLVSLTINQANATILITPYNVTYDTTSHTATGTATGVGGVNLAADLTLSGTTHTNAGTYVTDGWSFTDPTGNYASTSGTVSDKINQANATILITPYNVTYDGNAHTATGTATGVGGVNLAADLTLSGTTHTSAGTYASDGWSFTDPTGNYASTSGTITDTINKAASAVVLTTSLNPILLQNPVTYTATVSSTAGKPTGTVTFQDGGVALTACTGVSVTVSTGLASCAVTYTATGTHSITVLYNGDTNFLSAGPSNTVFESAIDINLGAPTSGSGTGSSESILPGATATYSFPIAPSSGNSFPAAVTFTVTGLPTGAIASLAPSAWSLNSSSPWSWTLPANTTLTGNTVLSIQVPQATASALPAGGTGSNLASRLAPFSLALLLLPFAGRLRKSGKRLGRLLTVLLLLGVGMAAMAGLSGCGSNNGFFAQAQRSYTVIVTVSSGSLSHTSTITLTVE
jgi:hypothetical protein